MLVDVAGRGHATELLPELLEQRQQLLAGRKAPRYEPGLALRAIPAAEVLDHGLWVDGGLRIGGELAHRRRAPQPFGGLLQLRKDLLVRVALANPGLELGKRLSVDVGDRPIHGLAGHLLQVRIEHLRDFASTRICP